MRTRTLLVALFASLAFAALGAPSAAADSCGPIDEPPACAAVLSPDDTHVCLTVRTEVGGWGSSTTCYPAKKHFAEDPL